MQGRQVVVDRGNALLSVWLILGVLVCGSDPENPKLAGRLWLGGSIRKGGPVKVRGKHRINRKPKCQYSKEQA